MKTLNPHALGVAAAAVSALCMLLLGILAMAGVYMAAFEAMQAWHIWFDATVLGTLGGMIEAAVVSYVGAYLFGWVYSKAA